MVREILGIKAVTGLGKYLGFNFANLWRRANFYQPSTDRVQIKLQGWKSNLLSAGGELAY